jgi:hypothetical protein
MLQDHCNALLFEVAKSRSEASIVNILIDAGADVNSTNKVRFLHIVKWFQPM